MMECDRNPKGSFPENFLFERYRFTSQSIIYIHNLIRQDIQSITNRGRPLSSTLRLASQTSDSWPAPLPLSDGVGVVLRQFCGHLPAFCYCTAVFLLAE